MRLSTILTCLFGGALVNLVNESLGIAWAAGSVLSLAAIHVYTYHEGRRDGVTEACDYVEKFAKAQKDRS